MVGVTWVVALSWKSHFLMLPKQYFSQFRAQSPKIFSKNFKILFLSYASGQYASKKPSNIFLSEFVAKCFSSNGDQMFLSRRFRHIISVLAGFVTIDRQVFIHIMIHQSAIVSLLAFYLTIWNKLLCGMFITTLVNCLYYFTCSCTKSFK